MNQENRTHLTEILDAAIRRVDPYRMLHERLQLAGEQLVIRTDTEHERIDLTRFERVVVLGAGKAGAKMALAVEEILGKRLNAGVIAVKPGHGIELQTVRAIDAGHPVPDHGSIAAGRAVAELADGADERTLCLVLISGGGSALLTAPLEVSSGEMQISLTLNDLQQTTSALLECGATIHEVNCIRKHLSALKGGRLAEKLAPATTVSLILSDVVGDDLDAIASGLTAPDSTSYPDAMSIIDRYGIEAALPPPVREVLRAGIAGAIADTPSADSPVFGHVRNLLVGTNHAALMAAGEAAQRLGYHTVLLTSQLTGEARELAKVFVGIARDLNRFDLLGPRPCCVIGGGETTVTIRGSGLGGRNQELALSFVNELDRSGRDADGVAFLSASTDGNDGPTDATGAFASLGILEAARRRKLSPAEYLANNDAYHFFDELHALHKIGTTGTNVCDLQILLVQRETADE